LPVKKYYNVDQDFVVIDSTIFDFEPIPYNSLEGYESNARNYLNVNKSNLNKYETADIYHYIIHLIMEFSVFYHPA